MIQDPFSKTENMKQTLENKPEETREGKWMPAGTIRSWIAPDKVKFEEIGINKKYDSKEEAETALLQLLRENGVEIKTNGVSE